jgi:hypothetical protein
MPGGTADDAYPEVAHTTDTPPHHSPSWLLPSTMPDEVIQGMWDRCFQRAKQQAEDETGQAIPITNLSGTTCFISAIGWSAPSAWGISRTANLVRVIERGRDNLSKPRQNILYASAALSRLIRGTQALVCAHYGAKSDVTVCPIRWYC